MTFPTAAHALASEGGMARTRTLLAMGVTGRELNRARKAGEIVRPRQGLYALPTTSPQEFHAAAHGGVPAATTAARLHGLWVLDENTIHVWMGAEGRQLGDTVAAWMQTHAAELGVTYVIWNARIWSTARGRLSALAPPSPRAMPSC